MTRAFTMAVAVAALGAGVLGSRQAASLVAGSPASPPSQRADSLRFVAHPEHIAVGFPSSARPLNLVNPYEGNASARATGAKLFVSYNCIDCHGADGSGAMGPSLADGRWHFGGSPAELFESIYEGRPDGMPTWGGRIATDQIWMLVTYLQALSAGKDVATEDFTGATVERTGH